MPIKPVNKERQLAMRIEAARRERERREKFQEIDKARREKLHGTALEFVNKPRQNKDEDEDEDESPKKEIPKYGSALPGKKPRPFIDEYSDDTEGGFLERNAAKDMGSAKDSPEFQRLANTQVYRPPANQPKITAEKFPGKRVPFTDKYRDRPGTFFAEVPNADVTKRKITERKRQELLKKFNLSEKRPFSP